MHCSPLINKNKSGAERAESQKTRAPKFLDDLLVRLGIVRLSKDMLIDIKSNQLNKDIILFWAFLKMANSVLSMRPLDTDPNNNLKTASIFLQKPVILRK